MRQIGLYIHVPFCTGKCDYCSFYSITPTAGQVRRYFEALRCELDLIRERYFGSQTPTLSSVFIGGGTPTWLEPQPLAELMAIVHRHFILTDDCEVTSETSPETVEPEKMLTLVQAGVNRVSLGAQSFHDDLLTRIGRRHCRADIFLALKHIRSAGISNINMDLIFGLPGEDLAAWEEDVRTAVDQGPVHLACYELTYEPGTPLANRQVPKLDEDVLIRMYYQTKDMLESAGFEHYEISNYARPGFKCRHNLRYWRNQDYIGLGPAGAGYLGKTRYNNVADLDKYCSDLLEEHKLPIATLEQRRGLQLAGETAMVNLRTSEGIVRDEFIEQTGFDPFIIYAETLDRFCRAGLLEIVENRIRLSRSGLILSNEVIAELLC